MEEKQRNYKLCDICESQATLLCFECLTNYYCDSCYKLIHDKKAKSKHKKEKIDYFVPIDTRCPEHSNVALNLFCLDEKGNYILYIIEILYRTLLFNVLFYEEA